MVDFIVNDQPMVDCKVDYLTPVICVEIEKFNPQQKIIR
jgi:hypothetical protein